MRSNWARGALIVAALAVLTSCSSSTNRATGVASSSGGSAGSAIDGSNGGLGATTASTTAGSATVTTATPTTTAAAAAPTTAPLPTPGGPGSFAARYLRPGDSQQLTVAALVEPNADPQPGTLAHLQGVLQQVTGKPVTVTTVPIGAVGGSWSSSRLATVADASAPAPTAADAVLSLLFVHGDFGGDTNVLGVATRGDVAAVFVDQLAGSAGLIGSVAPIERAVSTHEVGHLLGLVDLFLHTGRQDPDHPGHSTDKQSVMYWAVESSVIGEVLGANPPTEFDSADRGRSRNDPRFVATVPPVLDAMAVGSRQPLRRVCGWSARLGTSGRPSRRSGGGRSTGRAGWPAGRRPRTTARR